jgi:putative ABC transport system permease protein
MSFDPSLVRYTEDQARQFYLQLAERARSLPGVKSVALASAVPISNNINVTNVIPEGYQLPVGRDALTLFSVRVDENYFDTIGIPIVRGRGFREADSTDAPRVAVINEQYALHYLPNQDPIGRRFQVRERGELSWVTIVGVAKTTKYLWLGEPPTDFLYLPYRQNPQSDMVLLTETAGDPASLVAPLRGVVQELDRTQPIFNVRTMDELYRMRTITIFNVIIGTVAGMGLMGLALAVVGLYGLVAYATSRRTKEIGIRMAIGASRNAVMRMVLRQGLVLALAGAGAERFLQAAFPSGDASFNPTAHLLVAPIVLAAMFVAAYLPARRAARVDPMKALRYE